MNDEVLMSQSASADERENPLTTDELDELVAAAMRMTQSRADLLVRNDELLERLQSIEDFLGRLNVQAGVTAVTVRPPS